MTEAELERNFYTVLAWLPLKHPQDIPDKACPICALNRIKDAVHKDAEVDT